MKNAHWLSDWQDSPYPRLDQLLKRAKKASVRLDDGVRDDGAGQVIDELVARIEAALSEAELDYAEMLA